MRSFKAISLFLAASIAISFANAGEQTAHSLPTAPRRHLRVQHGGADDHEVSTEAGIPGNVKAAKFSAVQSQVTPAAVSAPATVSAPVGAGASGSTVGASSPATPPPQSQYQIPTAPASPTTDAKTNAMPSPVNTVNTINVNAKPSSVNTNINIAPAAHTTTVIGVPAPAPAPAPAPVPAPAPAPQPVLPPAPVSKPSTSGLGFGDLNPLTMVATLAHTAHGALLGHTGTVPSSYMQGKSGGGGGHGH